MLEHIKRWLGWDSDSAPAESECPDETVRSRSATFELFLKHPAAGPAPPAAADQSALSLAEDARRGAEKTDKRPEGKPQSAGVDPYDTGTFNRPASWERVRRRGR